MADKQPIQYKDVKNARQTDWPDGISEADELKMRTEVENEALKKKAEEAQEVVKSQIHKRGERYRVPNSLN